jgi:CheY-like chemotaxis protein
MASATAECILVVDDDVDIRESLIELFEEHGCTAVGAANGRAALDALESMPPEQTCLILLDLTMPVMDGREFREEQMKRQDSASIPVVVISAYPDRRAEMEALDIAGYLPKPVKAAELMSTVTQYCPCDAAKR